MLTPCAAKCFALLAITQQNGHSLGAGFHRFNEVRFVSSRELHRYAACSSCDDRALLPKGFRDDQTETFAQGLLNDYITAALEDIHFHAADPAEVSEYVKIFIA